MQALIANGETVEIQRLDPQDFLLKLAEVMGFHRMVDFISKG
jgi:hypothetical protein